MKKQTTKDELRERILVRTQATITQGGIHSLPEILQGAGISRATFYRAFSSREELLRALAIEPEAESRERLLEKALAMIGQQGLAALSMDALADAAGVSRATLYRLFPGKAALFREVVRTYAPFERLARLIEQVADRPPEDVMPQVAQVIVELFGTRAGLFRTLAFEISGQQEDTSEATAIILEGGIRSLLDYLQRQVEQGHLRPVAPFVALQAFFGPIVFHLLTRSLAEKGLGLALPIDEVIVQFVSLWLRAMKSEHFELLDQRR